MQSLSLGLRDPLSTSAHEPAASPRPCSSCILPPGVHYVCVFLTPLSIPMSLNIFSSGAPALALACTRAQCAPPSHPGHGPLGLPESIRKLHGGRRACARTRPAPRKLLINGGQLLGPSAATMPRAGGRRDKQQTLVRLSVVHHVRARHSTTHALHRAQRRQKQEERRGSGSRSAR